MTLDFNTISAIITLLIGQGILRYILEWILQKPQRKQNELQVIIDQLREQNESLSQEVNPLRIRNNELSILVTEKDIAIATFRAVNVGMVQRATAMQLELDECRREKERANHT